MCFTVAVSGAWDDRHQKLTFGEFVRQLPAMRPRPKRGLPLADGGERTIQVRVADITCIDLTGVWSMSVDERSVTTVEL
jgi:hypothetical protein